MKNENGFLNLPRCICSKWVVAGVFSILLVFFLFNILSLKFAGLNSWLVTSDIFSFDQLLNETLKGHFGLEYTYGNQFGDHAYIILLLMLPIKILLGQYFVEFLLLLSPFLFVGTCLYIYVVSQKITNSCIDGLLLGCVYLFSLKMFEAVYEVTYGFHPDTLAGFLATIFGLLFFQYERGDNKKHFIWALFALFLFLSLKEEFALLACGYLTLLVFLYRGKKYLYSLIFFYILTILVFYFISLSGTPFNRGNHVFYSRAVELFLDGSIVENMLALIRKSPTYFNVVISSYFSFILLTIVLTKKLHPQTVAFIGLGVAKVVLSYIVLDFNLETWHNISIICFFSTAILIQILHSEDSCFRMPLICIALGINLYFFFPSQVNFYKVTSQFIQRVNPLSVGWASDIYEIKGSIDKNKITAIPSDPLYSAVEWKDGYRFTFFPRGVYMSPTGIADYIVLLKSKYPDKEIPSCYEIVHENKSYYLLERIPPCNQDDDRQAFIEYFGLSSIHP